MNAIATQQAALDNALVPSEKRLKIERCNARISFSKPQREETYKVTLEALKLSPCYPAFVITTKVPQIYMHQFWNTITKIRDTDAYSFKLDKKKYRVDTEVFHEILQICPRILNQDFIALPSEEDLVTFIQELGYSGRCNMLSTIHTDQMHQPWRTFAAIINRINLHTIRDDSLLGNLKFVSKTQDYQQYGALIPDDMINQDIKDSQAYKTYYDFATGKVPPRKARKYKKFASPSRKLSPLKEAEPIKKGKRVKRSAKKSTTTPTAGVVLRDTLVCLYRRRKHQLKSENESWGDSEDDNDDDSDDNSKGDDDKADNDDDGNSDADDNERTYSDDDDENPSFTLKDYDEEEHDEEYKFDDDYENMFEEEDDDDLYKDVDQVVEDAHVTLTTSQKTDDSKQSSYVSSEFASKFLILENLPLAVDEVASMMHVKNRQEESSTQAPSLFTVPVTAIPETATAHATTVSPTILMITPPPQLTTPFPAPTTVPTITSIPALLNFSSLLSFDQRVSTLETELSQLKQADLSA
ncbi:hypothetical protein Tco_0712374 [Tanacetum coccineum]